MCGVKLFDKRRTKDLIGMLGLKELMEWLARVNGVRWYGYVLRKDEEHILRGVIIFEVNRAQK